jgi:peptidoglycan/LPS O-acetylase OafA/YrhL
MSFADVLKRHKGIGPGFDFLRVFLAITIVMYHSCLQTKNNQLLYDTPFWFSAYALVPMFFMLSGFLVAGSGMRLSLGNFLINRGLRIVPALGVDIFVCALIIGPIFTTLDLSKYFTNHEFHTYFLNITGWIHYTLPGVFRGHPMPSVNGALWTVPYEIGCYAILSGFIATGFLKRPRYVAIAIVGMFAIGLLADTTGILQRAPHLVADTIHFVFVSRGAGLLVAFLIGVWAYQLRDKIPYDRAILAAAIVICLVASLVLDRGSIGHVPTRLLVYPALAYITIFIGVTPVPIPKFFHTGDYSYGIYLYHVPILQCVIALFPALALAEGWGPAFTFVVAAPVVGLVAFTSWHLVEKPVLALRKKFSFVARVRDLGETTTQGAIGAAPVRSTETPTTT